MKKIYIAGKVTGENQAECIAKFKKAQCQIEDSGHEAVNPLEVVGDWNATWRDAMKKCLTALIDCDAILILDDWHSSKGAKIEFRLAMDLGMTIMSGGQIRPFFIPITK